MIVLSEKLSLIICFFLQAGTENASELAASDDLVQSKASPMDEVQTHKSLQS